MPHVPERALMGLEQFQSIYTRSIDLQLGPLLERGAAAYRDQLRNEGLPATLALTENSAPALGHLLVELDRELRRAVAIIETPGSITSIWGRGTPSPHGPPVSTVLSASSGSLHLLLELIGEARNVLLSQPLRLIMTLNWLWQFRPSTWGGRHLQQDPNWQEMLSSLSANAAQASKHEDGVVLNVRRTPHGQIHGEFESVSASKRRG